MDKSEASLQTIRGWLLVYVIWGFWCAAFAIFINGYTVISISRILPGLALGASIVFILVLVFYSYYCLILWQLIHRKQGILKIVKILILCSPVFNALIPAFFIWIIVLAHPEIDSSYLCSSVYDTQVISNLAGAFIISLIWFAYFLKSKRVRTIWPKG